MKNKDYLNLVTNIRDNIIISDFNGHDCVCKMRLNDCISMYKSSENETTAEFYFKEIQRLLTVFNVRLNLEFEDVVK